MCYGIVKMKMFNSAAKNSSILFVREGTLKNRRLSDAECRSTTTVQGTLTGTEAKTFYEEVISMPKESPSTGRIPVRRKRNRSTTKKRVQTTKHLKVDHTSHASINQVFGCVQEGNLEGVKSAISNGVCDVNTKDQFQWSLLMSAAHAGHVNIVEYLLSVGAEWRGHVDRSGCDAVDLARKAGHLSIASFIGTYNDKLMDKDKSTKTHLPFSKLTSFFCEICKQTITSAVTEQHSTSTVHQFNCQHHPNHNTNYTIPQSNRGYQMMLRGGWNPEKGLGCEQGGQKYPVKTILKWDRLGFGQLEEGTLKGKARVTHFAAFDERAVKRQPERFEKRKTVKKKDILMATRKDKQWEVRMRRYMNTDLEITLA